MLSLPDSLIRCVVADWLCGKDIVRFDTACTNDLARQRCLREVINGSTWHQAHISSCTIVNTKEDRVAYNAESFDLSGMLEWLCSREMRLDGLTLEVSLPALTERPLRNHQYPFVSHLSISSRVSRYDFLNDGRPLLYSSSNALQMSRTLLALPGLTYLDIRSSSCPYVSKSLFRSLDSLPLLTSLFFGHLSVASADFFQAHGHKVKVIEEPSAHVFELMSAHCPNLSLLPLNMGDLVDSVDLDFVFTHFPCIQKYHCHYFLSDSQSQSHADMGFIQIPYKLKLLRCVDVYFHDSVIFLTLCNLLEQCEHMEEINTPWFSWKKLSASSSFMEIISDMGDSVVAEFSNFVHRILPIRSLHVKCFVKSILPLLPTLLSSHLDSIEELELSWIRPSSITLLLPVLPSFQALKSVRFVNSSVVMPSCDFLPLADALAASSPHLQSITFNGLGFVSNAVVAYFVQKLPTLVVLELEDLPYITSALLMRLISPLRVWDRIVIRNCAIDEKEWAASIEAGLQVKMVVGDFCLRRQRSGKATQVGYGHIILRPDAFMRKF